MEHDLIVIGGSFAGLSAAVQLGRAGRKVLVLDAGQPRNRFSSAAHGIFALDGTAPSQILATAQKQTLAYPAITHETARVASVQSANHGFFVADEAGHSFQSRRVLIATGVADSFPDIPGMRERWGDTVLHCPYCHGYEYMGKETGVFALGPIAFHQALLLADWGPVTLFTNAVLELDDAQLSTLASRHVKVENAPLIDLYGDGTKLDAVGLADGRKIPLGVLYIATQVALRNDWVSALGCNVDQGPLGPMIATDERQATSVAGVYAAGDCSRQPHNATFACADGVTAGMAIHMSLIEEELKS
ncbi:MAG: NAD(P)/FAD-dependent oxidoreductase [Pseudomonadota bacterium]